ncbi:MAG: BPL-N domain-containing protein [Syntrophobacteraceae bacterium]
MRNNPRTEMASDWGGPPIAVFWDQSLVWGLILLATLDVLKVPYHLITGRDIRTGLLDRYRVLVVPGGWASHKLTALGERGASAIRSFVQRGGSYLGFCGGAGLALSSAPSLGLVPLERMSLADRLPNASGTIFVRGVSGHPAWKGLPEVLPVSIWWPSQFAWHPMPGMLCLASYSALGEDFCVADLPFRDLAFETVPWPEWESIYGINLDPTRLLGHPAIVELRVGRGHVMLSYPHLETPGDIWGNRLLGGLLAYLDRLSNGAASRTQSGASANREPGDGSDIEALSSLRRVRESFEDLIAFGERHLLWRWRNSWLLQWRRGIRGLEYGSLTILARTAVRLAEQANVVPDDDGSRAESTRQLLKNALRFCDLAKRLLIEEKLATQSGRLTKLGAVNDTVDAMRAHLFGRRMNHGGLCGDLFDELDDLLCRLLRASLPPF